MDGHVCKVMKNRLGEYVIWWGVEGSANRMAMRIFFKDKTKANIRAKKFGDKMFKGTTYTLIPA